MRSWYISRRKQQASAVFSTVFGGCGRKLVAAWLRIRCWGCCGAKDDQRRIAGWFKPFSLPGWRTMSENSPATVAVLTPHDQLVWNPPYSAGEVDTVHRYPSVSKGIYTPKLKLERGFDEQLGYMGVLVSIKETGA